mgnify:FL=1
MLSKYKLNQLYFKDTQFANLMTRRIFNVLLIANPYDAFMLEDDGRIDEKIFNEYTSLSLRYPPRFSQVSTEEEALTQLENMSFDLVICMPSTGDNDSFDIGRHIKEKYEHIPIVILTPFSHGITKRIINEDLSAFEYVFCWLGNTDLLVSIIKLMEDKMNLEHDVQEVGVQMILLVEDGIRFYSSILPNLYKFVLKQSQEFSTEALNAHQRTLRMRGRPKIVLARTYQEAMEIYRKYQNNILGVITDVRFPKVERGEKDGLAGIKLCAAIRKNDPFVPLIIQSSESENSSYAAKYGASFIDKNSKKMDVDLRRIVSDNFGFGDFVFRNPETGEEIARVRNLKELQNILFAVPAESFLYHISRNHVSRWLYSRAMFPVAEFLRILPNEVEVNVLHRRVRDRGILKIPCALGVHKLEAFVEIKLLGFIPDARENIVRLIGVKLVALQNLNQQNIIRLTVPVGAGKQFGFDLNGRLTVIKRHAQQLVDMLLIAVDAGDRPVVLHADRDHAAICVGKGDQMNRKRLCVDAGALAVKQRRFRHGADLFKCQLAKHTSASLSQEKSSFFTV